MSCLSPIVGLYPAGLQDLCLPSFETKERICHQEQRQGWLMDGRHLHVLPQDMKQGPGATPHHVWCTGSGTY